MMLNMPNNMNSFLIILSYTVKQFAPKSEWSVCINSTQWSK